MSTSDPRGGVAPPLELSGPLAQVSPAGGISQLSLLAPNPLPSAVAGSGPGTGTAAPSALTPSFLPGDPQTFAALLARAANELFTAWVPPTSVVASPAPAPMTPTSSLATPPSVPGGPPLVPGGTPVTSGITPAFGPAAPEPTPAGAPLEGLGGLGGGPGVANSSPFAPPSFDSLLAFDSPPSFDGAALGLDPSSAPYSESLRFPALDDAASPDAPPYFIPDDRALGLETDLSRTDVTSFEHAADRSPPVRNLGGAAFDPYAVRRDFPILEERVHGKRLVWLDNAATTQKPRAVIDRLSYFYEHENSNIHRAAHTLAARATDAYEAARDKTRRLLNAPSSREIVFVRGATEGINLIAQSWGRRNVAPGDEIVITWLEHHANIVPWQMLCAEKGARLRVAPADDRGDVILEEYEKLLGPKTKLVAFPHVSNALGTVTPAREMIEMAHRYGATVLVDGAQAVSHMRVDVQALDCDFYVFSGHKVFAPTGIGAVYGKREVLAAMPPWQGGGNMIDDVTFERTVYQPPPMRFEAGTGNIADAVGLGAAIDYLTGLGLENVSRHEHDLLEYGTRRLLTIPGLKIIGTSPNKAGVISFVLDGHRSEDIGAALDREGIAVRSGHHCAQPILRRFGVEATVRASLAPYNVYEDLDALVDAVRRLSSNLG